MNSGLQSALSGLLVAACLAVADTKMSFSDLPRPARTAVKEQLRGAGSEEEHGRIIYEVETMLNGKSRDLNFDAAGKLLEVEQQVDISGIPAAAKAALEKTSAGGSIRKVEMVTAGDSVSYEASVVTQAGKHREVAVNPDGTPHRD
jgi:uncharacterized membrane protein YkoI